MENDVFKTIDGYFTTFQLLHFSITECIDNYFESGRIYSRVLEESPLLFAVGAVMVKDYISRELIYKRIDKNEIERHIKDRYNTTMQNLTDFYYNDEIYNLPFPVNEIHCDITNLQKMMFFHNLARNKNNQQTIYDFQCAIIQELEAGYKEINELFEPTTVPDEATKESQQIHFTRSFTGTERQSLFNGLVSNGYIPKDTNAYSFNFVFGEAEAADFEPILWLKDMQDLKIFIDTFFPNEKSKWKKTISCFRDNQGKEINYNSIRNLNPKYKDNPPSEAYFKKLKKELEG